MELLPSMNSKALSVDNAQGGLFRPFSVLLFGICLALSLLMISPSYGVIEIDQLSSPELSYRYRQLIEEYRCPKCQNQNLAGSDSPISADLRREIKRMLEDGASDEQISDFLVARYGDFVLYRPRLQQGTYLLWLGPGLLLVIGLSVAGMVISRQRSRVRGLEGSGISGLADSPVDQFGETSSGSDNLSETEQRQLEVLLGASDTFGPVDSDEDTRSS